MKNKKLPIIIGIVLGLLVIVGVILFIVLKQNKITITYISDDRVSSTIQVKKGEKLTLPVTRKDGYTFEGWYYEGEKLQDGVWFDHDVIIVAKWLEMNKPTMTITFNTDGGKNIEASTIECDSKLDLPVPVKDGYKFVNWLDKNEVIITNETKLACEDVTLKAKWEEEKKTDTKKEEPKPAEVKKEYTCPSGYTLNGTKCTIEGTVKEKCGERGFDYSGKCVTITGNVRRDTKRTCPEEHVTYMSFAGQVDGKVVDWGVIGCAYYKTNDTRKENCESHGFKWVTPENACYVKWISNNTINTCDHLSGYAYISDPNTYDGVNGLNGGCYPLSDKTKYCDDGYTLTDNKCIKTIDATLK